MTTVLFGLLLLTPPELVPPPPVLVDDDTEVSTEVVVLPEFTPPEFTPPEPARRLVLIFIASLLIYPKGVGFNRPVSAEFVKLSRTSPPSCGRAVIRASVGRQRRRSSV